MPYTHGVYVQENPTPILAPVIADSAIQFIVGTAPINLLDEPSNAVNVPILINSYAEAVKAVGFSKNFEAFTLCQSIAASFQVYNVAPLVLVNVLDPAKHVQAVLDEPHALEAGQVLIEKEGILKADFVVKSSDKSKTFTLGTDYTIEFDSNGYLLLSRVTTGTIPAATTALSISYDQLDPSLVKEEDIIGGYNATTGQYTGLENVGQVYPKFGVVPGMILAPGWSHIPAVGIAMTAKTDGINGAFKCIAVKDADAETIKAYTDVPEWKKTNSYTDKNDIVLWPKIQIDDKQYYYSAVWAALMAYTDYNNDNVPYVSPSNKQLRITGTVLADGTEVYLDQVQGNYLNGQGIITAININGWRSWGNNTGVYPGSSDVKDRFIPVRRMFNWWGNTFILTYFQKVDDPMNRRLIETVVDTENIRANGYKARYQIADARIEYRVEENPVTDLLNGIIRFKQYLTPFTPAETIIDVLEFDPNALAAALGGES
jgi:phage tail sheath protein FI